MRERQGCRSVSIEGDLGDVGVRRLFRLRARRVDGWFGTVPGDGSRLPVRRRLGTPSLPV
jgi:hypothetical protein